MDVFTKREREKQLVSQMISLYCRKSHHTKGDLCSRCKALNEYAASRSEHCPFMEHKTFCSNCKVHCYKTEMRAEIKKVMGFSAPRMLLIHPIITIRHMAETIKEKRRLEIKNEN